MNERFEFNEYEADDSIENKEHINEIDEFENTTEIKETEINEISDVQEENFYVEKENSNATNFTNYVQENQNYETKIPYEFEMPNDHGWRVVSPKSTINFNKPKNKKPISAAKILAISLIIGLISGVAGGSLITTLNSNPNYTTTIQNASTQTVNVQNVSVKSGDVLSVSEISDKVGPAVVSITSEILTRNYFGGQSSSYGSGSGVILTQDGYIVTNYHVIEGATKITVKLSTGQEYIASIVGDDVESDLAILKINASNLPSVVLGDSSLLKVGDLAVAIGNPLGELSGTVTSGIISATDRVIPMENNVEMTLLQTDASINPGNSGGALANQFGEVIGIVNAKSSGYGVEGLGFAIPINHAKSIINELMTNGYVSGRTTLGIAALQEVTQEASMFFRMTPGLYITSLTANGPAANAGAKNGDRIISFAGQKVSSLAEIKKIKDDYKVGDKVAMVVERNGQSIPLNITLAEERK